MSNINTKYHRVERVNKTHEIQAVKPKIIGKPEPERKIRLSRKLNGCIIMDIEGYPNITLQPRAALALAAGIFKGLDIEIEYDWDGMLR